MQVQINCIAFKGMRDERKKKSVLTHTHNHNLSLFTFSIWLLHLPQDTCARPSLFFCSNYLAPLPPSSMRKPYVSQYNLTSCRYIIFYFLCYMSSSQPVQLMPLSRHDWWSCIVELLHVCRAKAIWASKHNFSIWQKKNVTSNEIMCRSPPSRPSRISLVFPSLVEAHVNYANVLPSP